MVLHLDKNFKPITTKEIEYESFVFAGGEPHIKINPDFDKQEVVTITHRLNSFNDLGLLCVAVDALRRLQVQALDLVIPYFPAARQDRVMVQGEPLSVKVYADIINSLGFKKVVVFDAHSEVTAALVNNCQVIPNHQFIRQVIEKIGTSVKLISPDGGALKKIYKVSEALGGVEVIECSKSRNVKTGQLLNFKVYADDLAGESCLIVDDICDGGGTFIGLSQELKKKNAGKLYLAVSHGIFSKGFAELSQHFEHIFTTDSIKNLHDNCLTQIQLNHGLLS
jgi:ribose-phosphate pyrophosphokinase